MKKIQCEINSLNQAFANIEEKIKEGEHEFDFSLISTKDILWSDDELEEYKIFLDKINTLVIEYYLNNQTFINIHPITDIYGLTQGTLPDNSGKYVLCNNCPCYQCKPDTSLFKKYTKTEYIPPVQFCKKHFYELNSAYKILNKNNIETSNIINIEIEDYICLNIKNSGSMILGSLFKNEFDNQLTNVFINTKCYWDGKECKVEEKNCMRLKNDMVCVKNIKSQSEQERIKKWVL